MRLGTRSWRMARIRGVDLNIHISLLLLLPYLVLITAARFDLIANQANIDSTLLIGGPLIWGLILAIALFVSVTLHEFGHALTAQSLGIKVRSITLMILGGVSSMEQIPDQDYAEFKLAIVGPLVSLAIAAIAFWLEPRLTSPNFTFLAFWLSRANLTLAIFNLIPAIPLDGGRALRSILAVRRGPLQATRTAVKISQAFAWMLGILGLIGFNVLLVLIAVFIYSASQAELSFLLTRGLLHGLCASEVMIRTPAIHETEPLTQAASQMLYSHHSILPVITSIGTPALVTLERIKKTPKDFWTKMAVKDILEEAPQILDTQDSIEEALPNLLVSPASALPVRQKGEWVGIVRYVDLIEILQFRSLKQSITLPSENGKKRAA